MKKSNLYILLVLAVLTIAWTNRKKTKAGELILSIDKGEFITDNLLDQDTKKMYDI